MNNLFRRYYDSLRENMLAMRRGEDPFEDDKSEGGIYLGEITGIWIGMPMSDKPRDTLEARRFVDQCQEIALSSQKRK